MGLLDTILDIGTAFDWISPLKAEIDDIRNGPNHTFYIYRACGRSVNNIVKLLRRGGIKTWGHMIVNDDIMITVRKDQATDAQRILNRHGLPLHYGAVSTDDW